VARRSKDWNEGLAEDLQDATFARQFLAAAVDEGIPLKMALAKVIELAGSKSSPKKSACLARTSCARSTQSTTRRRRRSSACSSRSDSESALPT